MSSAAGIELAAMRRVQFTSNTTESAGFYLCTVHFHRSAGGTHWLLLSSIDAPVSIVLAILAH
jgi:hypothetical protein